jgi:hypothetical protein
MVLYWPPPVDCSTAACSEMGADSTAKVVSGLEPSTRSHVLVSAVTAGCRAPSFQMATWPKEISTGVVLWEILCVIELGKDRAKGERGCRTRTNHDSVTERLGQKDAVLLSPLKLVVGQKQLLVARRHRGSALEDDIVDAVDLKQSGRGITGPSLGGKFQTFLAMQSESLEWRARTALSMRTLSV